MDSPAQTVPPLPFSPEEVQRSLSFVSFLQSEELKKSFQAVSEYDFARFRPETLSQEEAERLSSFLQIAEFFVPLAAQQPLLQTLVPAEIWKAIDHFYQKLSPYKALLEQKKQGQTTPKNNDYLDNYRKNHRPMTIKEQMAFQEATKPPLKSEDVLGKWPGDETDEEILTWLQTTK